MLKKIPKKKKGGKEEKKVVRDRSNPEFMLPHPRPLETSEDIRKLMKTLAEDCEKEQLEYAAQVKTWAIPGEKTVGWRFPKEEEIKQTWVDWNKLYDQQTDLVATIQAHFEDATRRWKEQKEAERKELEG